MKVQRRLQLTTLALGMGKGEALLSRGAREQAEKCSPAADRYALQRLVPRIRKLPARPAVCTCWDAAIAVYATIGANENDDDVVHRTGWIGTRMQSRYVQAWIMQHRECHAQDPIAALTDAVDRACAEDRGLVLPDLAPRPVAYPWTDAVARSDAATR